MHPTSRRYIVTIVSYLFLFVSSAYSQTQQVTISLDNDEFIPPGKDCYYTNGLFIKYDRIKNQPKRLVLKQIDRYELGQLIFTAHSRKILLQKNNLYPYGLNQIDRPIAGYLFGRISRGFFLPRNTMFEVGGSIGVIGKYSFAKDVQIVWHKRIGVKDHWNWVWDYQVSSELGLNLHSSYAKSIVINKLSFLQLTPLTSVSIGTMFTNINQSMLLQIGKFNTMGESAYWNSRIQESNDKELNEKVEIFVYYKPQLQYQLYNATVQGGMFTDNKGTITSGLVPFVITHETGLVFSTMRYSVGCYAAFQTKQAKGQFNNHSFANVNFSYRF